MAANALGPYEILGKIGAGGMGEVYRARDNRLGREVAIKLLPETASYDPQALERFRLEARAASALNHPNICTIHDVGEHQGRPFIVMELLDGETLLQILSRGPLAADRCVDLAVQLADALDAAHAKSIVHRDIKPGNIVVTARGLAKILDFGLAKLSASAGSAGDPTVAATGPGLAVGTVAYMSPEQALGRSVDARSDLFSFGTVLHEMASGVRAFGGDTAAAISDAILHGGPAGGVRSELSGLQPILDRLLQKHPERRYSTASELAQDLRRVRERPAERRDEPASIAVLPFVHMSADPDNDYFTDGMAEEILGALSKVQALRVASRTSSFAFKGRNEDVREIGRKLGVDSILEGSVRKSGKRLRIHVQLVKVEDGYRVWSERYDRELEDVFAVQDEIAESVANALRVVLTERERHVIRKVPTQNVEAYDEFLRGREQLRRLELSGFIAARKMFAHATEIDPAFALAWVGIAEACHWRHSWFDHDPELVAAARAASHKALALDADLAEAHVAQGLTHSMADEHVEARQAFERAIRLDPQNFEAYYYSARCLVSEGRVEEAAATYAKAADVRPEDYQAPGLLATLLRGLGRHEEARQWAVRALDVIDKHLELHPNDVRAVYLSSGCILFATGDREAALQRARRAVEMEPESLSVRYNLACTYMYLDMHDEALDLLERNVDEGWGQRSWVEHDPDWNSVHDHPRFTAILDRMSARGQD